jgi:hypothetical protein
MRTIGIEEQVMTRRCLLGVIAVVASACQEPGTESGVPGPGAAQRGCEERIWTGDYEITSRDALDALAPYTQVTGSVLIERIDSTIGATVEGPGCLASIGGDLWIRGQRLVSVSGFSGLTSIGGRLRAGNQYDDDPAVAVSGFDSLRVIGDSAYFVNTHEVGGFAQLERVGGTLRFSSGGIDVKGMNRLREVGSLRFTEVDIRGLDGLGNLKIVTGDLIFGSATLDVATTGLGELTTIGGMLYWEYGALGHDGLTAFRAIETIGDSLSFSWMTGPPVMDGFPELVTVGRHVAFDTMDGVERVRGFDQLCATGPLSFRGMDDLRKIDGFARLERASSLTILDHDRLQSVTLRDLESIDGDLHIAGNLTLNALNLPRLERLAGALTITGNPDLPGCQAQAVLDMLRAHGYAGPAQVENNGADMCD